MQKYVGNDFREILKIINDTVLEHQYYSWKALRKISVLHFIALNKTVQNLEPASFKAWQQENVIYESDRCQVEQLPRRCTNSSSCHLKSYQPSQTSLHDGTRVTVTTLVESTNSYPGAGMICHDSF